MSKQRSGVLLSVLALCLGSAFLWPPPRTTRAQGAAEVWLNVQKGGGAKLNIAVPAFTVLSGADPTALGGSNEPLEADRLPCQQVIDGLEDRGQRVVARDLGNRRR